MWEIFLKPEHFIKHTFSTPLLGSRSCGQVEHSGQFHRKMVKVHHSKVSRFRKEAALPWCVLNYRQASNGLQMPRHQFRYPICPNAYCSSSEIRAHLKNQFFGASLSPLTLLQYHLLRDVKPPKGFGCSFCKGVPLWMLFWLTTVKNKSLFSSSHSSVHSQFCDTKFPIHTHP